MFIEIPASKMSIALRRLSFGVGVNDADYIVCNKTDGKRMTCPFYKRWNHMLERCYSEKFLERNPSYKGCTTCEDGTCFQISRSG